MEKSKIIKIGNTSFRNDLPSIMTHKSFKKSYSEILKGMDLDEVWVKLGGKITKHSD